MYNKYFKRIVDFGLSLILLIILLPVILLICGMIRSQMGSPIFFGQDRTGMSGMQFRIYKFRTMNDEVLGDEISRITPLGAILRRWSLDEIPQLINVLKGEMSLIGPRPLLPEYDEYYSCEQRKRFLVRPGVSGLAQVTGRNELSWAQKFSLDIAYVENLSLRNDVIIGLKTIQVIFLARGFRKSGEEKKFSEIKREMKPNHGTGRNRTSAISAKSLSFLDD